MEKLKIDPEYTTDRLVLRQPNLDDVPSLQKYLSDFDIAKQTLSIPHPYPEGAAQKWVENLPALLKTGEYVAFSLILKETNELVGVGMLKMHGEHKRAEFGYWIAKPYWGKGYATEAAQKLLEISFKQLELNKVSGSAYTHNLASIHIMEKKLGMKYEGTFRKDTIKFGQAFDVAYYAILKDEYEQRGK